MDRSRRTTLANLLRERWYPGVVVDNDGECPGRHDARIAHTVSDKVQTLLNGRVLHRGMRDRRHDQYLTSIVWCGRCHNRDVESRLIQLSAVGKTGGEYRYFPCSNRAKGSDSP